MTDRELIARRLAGQHLTAPTDTLTAAGDLCGIQSQFYPQALHALRLRGGTGETEGLVKSWTLRGTLHLFPERDLPLFLHAGRTPFLRPCDTLAGDEVVSEVRKAYFADCVLERLSAGPALREELKAAKAQTETARGQLHLAQEEAEKARKLAAASQDEGMVRFKLLFADAQGTVNRMAEELEQAPEESRDKLRRAMLALADAIRKAVGE